MSEDTTVYDTTQVSERPVIRSAFLAPRYPPDLRVAGVQGRVVVGVTIAATGAVDRSSITVIQGADPAFDREATRYVAHATFWPGCRYGAAVRMRVAIPMEFRIGGRRLG